MTVSRFTTLAAAAVIASSAALSGCASSGGGPNEGAGTILGAGAGALTGGLVGGAIGGRNGAIVGAMTGGVLGGVAGNSIGRDLDEQDRLAAMDAANVSFASGERRPWRGPRGSYGYIEPGPQYAEARGTCRNFTNRIYVNGRPQVATGIACMRPDGAWQIVG